MVNQLDLIQKAVRQIVEEGYEHHIIIAKPLEDYKAFFEYCKNTYNEILNYGIIYVGVAIPSLKITIEVFEPNTESYGCYKDKDGIIYGGGFIVVRKLAAGDIVTLKGVKSSATRESERKLADECINWILNQ